LTETAHDPMKSTLRKTIRTTIVASALAAALVPAAQAQNEEFIPGYTDFPNALRVESDAQSSTFTPGHSDFPNHLRVDSIYDRARGNGGAQEPTITVVPAESGGFDWVAAGIGASGALGLILMTGGALLALHRRPTRRAALTA
jgi:hypothetical protein